MKVKCNWCGKVLRIGQFYKCEQGKTHNVTEGSFHHCGGTFIKDIKFPSNWYDKIEKLEEISDLIKRLNEDLDTYYSVYDKESKEEVKDDMCIDLLACEDFASSQNLPELMICGEYAEKPTPTKVKRAIKCLEELKRKIEIESE